MSCPSCAAAEASPCFPDRAEYLRCARCDLAWVSPRPSAEEMKARADYWSTQHHLSLEKLQRQFSAKHQEIAYTPLLNRLGGAAKPGKLLEVGCAAGAFLDAARSQGWQVQGVELAATSAEYARNEKGLDVLSGNINDLQAAAASFDAIAALDVIEHLPDPFEFLRRCHELLTPGGSLLLLTPNLSSLSARWLKGAWEAVEPLDHPWLFSPQALESALQREGFVLQRQWAIDVNPAALLRRSPKGEGNRVAANQARSSLIRRVEASRLLLWLRSAINYFLSKLNLGDKLIVVAVKAP